MILFCALMFVLSGLLVTLLSVPLIRRQVPPNGLYGFRTEKTLGNESVWYQANEYAGKRLLLTGIAWIAVALLMLLVPFLRDNFLWYVGVNTITTLVGTFTALFASVAYSEKL